MKKPKPDQDAEAEQAEALKAYLTSTGKGALAVVAVDLSHEVDIRIFGHGFVCDHAVEYLRDISAIAAALGKRFQEKGLHGPAEPAETEEAPPPGGLN